MPKNKSKSLSLWRKLNPFSGKPSKKTKQSLPLIGSKSFNIKQAGVLVAAVATISMAAYLVIHAASFAPIYYQRRNLVTPANTNVLTKCPRAAAVTGYGPVAFNCVEMGTNGNGRVGNYSPITKQFLPAVSGLNTKKATMTKNLICKNQGYTFAGVGPIKNKNATLYYGNEFVWYGGWSLRPATYNASTKLCNATGDWQKITTWSSTVNGSSYPVTGDASYGMALSGDVFFNSAGSDFNSTMDGTKTAGAKWVRAWISWRDMQPKKNGPIDWSKADRLVDGAESRDLYLLVDIMPNWAPKWANGGHAGTNFPATNPADFRTFVTAVVKHYKDRGNNVEHWQIGNEPNMNERWLPSPSAANYVSQLKAAFSAIKTVDPGAMVIAAPLVDAGTKTINPIAYFNSMYNLGANQYYDAMAYHPYNYPDTAPNGTGWQEMIQIHNIMTAHGDGYKKVWVTEYGSPTCCLSQAAQAYQLRAAYGALAGYSWTGPMFWFTYKERPDSPSSASGYGLVDVGGNRKQAYYIYKTDASK